MGLFTRYNLLDSEGYTKTDGHPCSSLHDHISVFTFINKLKRNASGADVFNKFPTFASIWRFNLCFA